jgi:polysaccharide pyruvyl transferase WcaK-like protein
VTRRQGRRAPVRRIVFLGQLGIGNLGNEASLAAALRLLEPSDGVQVTVVCDAPDVVAAEHGVPAAPLHAPRPADARGRSAAVVGKARDAALAWRAVRATDAVLVPGTGILEGRGVSPGGIPLTLLWYAGAARLLRRPFLVLSVGADGLGGPLVQRLFRRTLAWSTYVTVRDDGSADVVERSGLPRPAVVPDLVLAGAPPRARGHRDGDPSGGHAHVDVLAARRSGRAEAEAFGEAFGDAVGGAVGGGLADDVPVVAVGVIQYSGFGAPEGPEDQAAYLDRAVRLVRRLVDGGAAVRVIGGAAVDAPTARRVVAAARLAGCPPQRVVLAPAADMSTLESWLRGCAAVVATRYHNLVSALRAGIPAVAIGYAEKQRWLLEQAGTPGRAHDVTTFTPEIVAAQVSQILAQGDVERAALAVSLLAARAALAAQRDRVRALLGLRPAGPRPDASEGDLEEDLEGDAKGVVA